MPTSRIKAGDLIAVPFDKGRVAVGLVLQRSRDLFRGCLLVGFYSQSFDATDTIPIEHVEGQFIAIPQYVHQWSVQQGRWPVIGHRDDLLTVTPLPVLRMSYDLYEGEKHLRRLTSEEVNQYPSMRVQGDGYVEEMLREHFTREE